MQNIIQRFIQVRKSMQITQAELAISLGFKQSYISNIEKGRNEVSSNIIIALYKLYNISPEWLITGMGEMNTNNQITHSQNIHSKPGKTNFPHLPTDKENSNISRKLIESLEKNIQSQELTIQVQTKIIERMESEIKLLQEKSKSI